MATEKSHHAPPYAATPGQPQHGHYAPDMQQPYAGNPYAAPQQHQQHYAAPQGNPIDPIRAGQEFQAQMMAQCAAGHHQTKTEYGVVGIILAVVCFPCGLIGLCVDKEKVCTRCGHRS